MFWRGESTVKFDFLIFQLLIAALVGESRFLLWWHDMRSNFLTFFECVKWPGHDLTRGTIGMYRTIKKTLFTLKLRLLLLLFKWILYSWFRIFSLEIALNCETRCRVVFLLTLKSIESVKKSQKSMQQSTHYTHFTFFFSLDVLCQRYFERLCIPTSSLFFHCFKSLIKFQYQLSFILKCHGWSLFLTSA